MKKILLTIFLFCCVVALYPQQFEEDGIYYKIIDDTKELEVINNPNVYSGKVVIPSFVMKYNKIYYVRKISDTAFKNCVKLTSIEIPYTVNSIPLTSFSGCSALSEIIVKSGNSVYDSRNNCNAIIETETNTLLIGCKNSVIPNSVTAISDFAFYFCTVLTSIVIPNSVTELGRKAFYNCVNLVEVELSKNITSIGDYAFHNCHSLLSVDIPEGVKNIGASAFSYCYDLNSVTIPYTVTSIGNSAFSNCDNLNCLYMECVTPPLVDFFTSNFYSPFYDVPDDAILYVPLGSKEKYANAYGWNYFKNIEEYIPTVIDDIKIESSKINNNIYYNLNGNIVDAPTKGVYILNGEKILLK